MYCFARVHAPCLNGRDVGEENRGYHSVCGIVYEAQSLLPSRRLSGDEDLSHLHGPGFHFRHNRLLVYSAQRLLLCFPLDEPRPCEYRDTLDRGQRVITTHTRMLPLCFNREKVQHASYHSSGRDGGDSGSTVAKGANERISPVRQEMGGHVRW